MSQNQDYTKHFYSPTIEDKYNAILDGSPKIDGKNYNLDDIDPYILQGDDISCALRAQEVILRDYGIIIPKDELTEFAIEKGWFSTDPETAGTEPEHIGNLLDACGVATTRRYNASIDDLITELNAGHRVIVGVDCHELWVKNEPNLFSRFVAQIENRVDDIINKISGKDEEDLANHALIVSGINVNPNNPSDVKVNIIDTGTGQTSAEYSLKEFYNAWKDGHFYMVSTNEPAPFQYNPETHSMEPSNVETNFIPSMIELPGGLSNRFKLDEGYYSQYADFQPTYRDDLGIYSTLHSPIDEMHFDYDPSYMPDLEHMTILPTQQSIIHDYLNQHDISSHLSSMWHESNNHSEVTGSNYDFSDAHDYSSDDNGVLQGLDYNYGNDFNPDA